MTTKRKRAGRRPNHAGTIVERDGQLYARLRFKDASGKTRFRERRVATRTEAEHALRQMRDEVSAPATAPALTFEKVAREYEEKKLVAPVYVGETRISGLRSWKSQRGFLRSAFECFGHRVLAEITYEDVVDYRDKRFATITRRGNARSVAQVNRELSILRSVFNYAKRRRLIAHSPFEQGESLISLADETRRDRILTFDEEKRLLAAISDRARSYLEPLILLAIDTGLRKGEILQLRWSDVDLTKRFISIRSTTTKTQRARMVPLTSRVVARLTEMQAASESESLFPDLKDFHKGFEATVERAGLGDLRFHDLRHVATTRMIRAGMPPAEVMKITGHTRFETFARYLNTDEETMQRAASLMDALHQIG